VRIFEFQKIHRIFFYAMGIFAMAKHRYMRTDGKTNLARFIIS